MSGELRSADGAGKGFLAPKQLSFSFRCHHAWIWHLEELAPHSSTLAWKIPWMEEPGRLQSMGSLRVGHDWATSLSLFIFMHWRRKWQPTPVFLPGESRGWGSLVGCRLWVTQSQTRLKWLSSENLHIDSGNVPSCQLLPLSPPPHVSLLLQLLFLLLCLSFSFIFFHNSTEV